MTQKAALSGCRDAVLGPCLGLFYHQRENTITKYRETHAPPQPRAAAADPVLLLVSSSFFCTFPKVKVHNIVIFMRWVLICSKGTRGDAKIWRLLCRVSF